MNNIDKAALNIIVVDDESFICKLLVRALTNLGYTSVTAHESAFSALEAIDYAARPPDLILLDLNMPDMDGVEFVRYLVKRNYGGSLIFVSGEDERMLQAADKLARAHQITSLGFLRKPVKPEALAALIDKWTPASADHWSPLDLSKSVKLRIAYTAEDRKSTRLNSSHVSESRMPSSA